MQFCLEIKTCDPLNYTMDHSKFIASIQKKEFISSFKSSANYYFQQQSLNYMYMMKHQIMFFCLFCCFTSQVTSYGHCGTVSSPNHTFSWASLNKQLTSTLCTYFRL